MLVETNNLVSEETFREDFERFVTAAKNGGGPVAIMRDSEVVGVFVSPAEYDAAFGAEVRKLLKSRERGPKVSHEAVRAQAQKIIDRRRKK
jgi:hypothetical protein